MYPKGGSNDPYFNTHEPGHVLQFFLLGAYYYPLVAIPSFLDAAIEEPSAASNFPTEMTANQIWYWFSGESDTSTNPLYIK